MSDFHFIRLWWLVALLPVAVMYWRLLRQNKHEAGWNQFLPGHLAKVLVNSGGKASSWPIHRLALMLTIASTALAGPTWEKLPQPVYQLESGQVVIMDMSPSLLAEDVTPNRLTQLRFKAIDLVRSGLDGDTGLIAYADDAFTISPLTADNRNLINLIPSLSPEIMPLEGSEPIRALKLANELLANAGYPQGDIYWLTDGISSRDLQPLTDYLRDIEHRVSILGVGTEDGAPVRNANGSLVKENGRVVIAKLFPDRLSDLAQITNGVFVQATSTNDDIDTLTALPPLSREGKDNQQQQRGDAWKDMGPYVALFILPLLLASWRKGALLTPLVLAFIIPMSLSTPKAYAQEAEPNNSEGVLSSLFLNNEQRAQQLYQNEQFEQASKLSSDPLRKGAALYKQGLYAEAADSFAKGNSAEAHYNRGNALAQEQQFEQASEAYQQALEQRPGWQQAKENLDVVKKLQEKQQQEQSGESGDENSESDKNSEQSNDKQGNNQSNNQGQNQQGDNSDSQSQPQKRESRDPQQQQKQDKQEPGQQEEAEKEQARKQQEDNAEGQTEQQIAQFKEGEIDPEKARQLEQWMNRVPDDPSILLRNKMLLESQRRNQRRASQPQGEKKKW